jgi:hypothetical protein
LEIFGTVKDEIGEQFRALQNGGRIRGLYKSAAGAA